MATWKAYQTIAAAVTKFLAHNAGAVVVAWAVVVARSVRRHLFRTVVVYLLLDFAAVCGPIFLHLLARLQMVSAKIVEEDRLFSWLVLAELVHLETRAK